MAEQVCVEDITRATIIRYALRIMKINRSRNHNKKAVMRAKRYVQIGPLMAVLFVSEQSGFAALTDDLAAMPSVSGRAYLPGASVLGGFGGVMDRFVDYAVYRPNEYSGSILPSPVPEPATFSLIGAGALLALRRRRTGGNNNKVINPGLTRKQAEAATQ